MSNKIVTPSQSKKLCLFGAGGHGRVVASQLKRQQELHLCFGDAALQTGDNVDGINVDFRSILDIKNCQLIITIGDNPTRRHLQVTAEAAGHFIAHFVSNDAHYFAEQPKAGAQILSGAIINTGVVIGAGVIINSGAIVEHDSIVDDYCHIAPGSVICGGAKLGENVLIGANATVLPGISIVSNCIVGSGAVVTHHLNEAGTYIGVPAKRIPK